MQRFSDCVFRKLGLLLVVLRSLDAAGVVFCLAVVVDAYEEEVASVFGEFGRVVLAFDLFDGGIGRLIEFQFYHHGW